MLTVGDKFPEFDLTACVSLEKGKEFEQINHKTYEGKWKIVFAWPKDFTFVCPTEIAAFGKLNDEFADRDARSSASPVTRSSCTTPGARTTRT